jgi:dimethylamine/trimethylamine dehydrogenase
MTPMRSPKHDVLFEPLEIRGKTFRNRFYSVPHAMFPLGRRMSEIGFRRMKAEGGWAAVCGGIISIREDNWDRRLPRIWDETDRVALGRVAAEVKREGALAGIELGHNGANYEGGKFYPSLSPSGVPDPDLLPLVPKELELDDIRELQDDWVRAATLGADLGYDIVYAYGGGGYLPMQFLSPYFNRRKDSYGGSLENRARFWLESIDRFRAAIGDRCLIAVRIAAESFSPYGVPTEDIHGFIRLADDLVDLWDVNLGIHWAPDSQPSRMASEGFQLQWSGQIRQATKKPIIGVGRLTNPDRMAEILTSGVWDFIGGARPSIADPYLPRKIEAGQYDDIRECTGSNFCIAIETLPAGLSCVQNPTIGEEYRRGWHPERVPGARDDKLDVLVVGAGPAGLECARVLGHRGFRHIHLAERDSEIGGHLAWLTQLPGMAEWARIIGYRRIQLDKLANVDVMTDLSLTAEAVLDYGAELVVLATGSHWLGLDAPWGEGEHHRFPGLATSPIATWIPEDVIADGHRFQGDKVAIWDGDGNSVAVCLAEHLARAGSQVTLVSRFDRVSPSLDLSFEGTDARRRLHEAGVATLTGLALAGAIDERLIFLDQFQQQKLIEATDLVLVTHRVPNDSLYKELRAAGDHRLDEAGIQTIVRIGDCLAPRTLGYVMAEAHRVGRELDSGSPSKPGPARPELDHEIESASFRTFDDEVGAPMDA